MACQNRVNFCTKPLPIIAWNFFFFDSIAVMLMLASKL